MKSECRRGEINDNNEIDKWIIENNDKKLESTETKGNYRKRQRKRETKGNRMNKETAKTVNGNSENYNMQLKLTKEKGAEGERCRMPN